MKGRLFVFIGGSDEQNGDYSLVQRLARRGGTANWSSLKDAKPGDRALIYIQQPNSALIAEARVLAEAEKTKPGDAYAYRAKTGHFDLLPNQIGIHDLKRAFPRWAWLQYPRGKAVVPAQYADRLWKMVHAKGSNVQVLISNADYGKKLLERMADTGRSEFWYVPKLTAVGDTVLFYVEEPVSAIVAIGKAVSKPEATSEKWYETKVGRVRLLDAPITLAELREMFPDWAWLRSVNAFAYVTPERSKALLKRCELKSSVPAAQAAFSSGAGFGDSETNKLVEQAAVRKVIRRLKQSGFTIHSRERDGVGYDLEATKGRTVLHVEVKGVSGELIQFPITRTEVRRAASDPSFRLMVVTQARKRNGRVHEFKGRDVQRRFVLQPLSYMAAKK